VKALFLLFNATKFGKFFISIGSMFLSIGAYALRYGWTYAIGFVFLLLVHELGHYVAAKRRGMIVGMPTFIPFVGAWIELKSQPLDSETEAHVAMAGPVLGGAAAFLVYLLSVQFDSRMLLSLAYAGFVLNLFNLIPLTPLDGGRIVSVVSPKIWFIGLPLLIAVFCWKPSPLLILIGVLSLPGLWMAFKQIGEGESPYYRESAKTRLNYGVQYLILTGLLCIVAFDIHEQLSSSN